MQTHLPTPELVHFISRAAERHVRARQVARRLEGLMPARLKQIERSHRSRHTPGKALRLALSDSRYLAYVEEAAELAASALEARVVWETHRMLFEARRSLQSFERARLDAQTPRFPARLPI